MNETALPNLPVAEPWSLTAGLVGKGTVYAGLAFFLLALVLWALSERKPNLAKAATAALWLGSASIFATMGVLIALFVKDQFQYEYIYARADTLTALKYKIAGVWSGQQGSFLLWGCASTVFVLAALRSTGPYKRWFAMTFAFFSATLCGILAYETPFNLMPEMVAHGKVFVPERGNGMTPALQNYWVVIHPPVIFLGFGALTVLFAYAVAAIMNRNLTDWVPRARPWAHAALAVLGLGICLGGFWAYETLGWGGFWAWDPVENVSFVPWLFVAGLVHGMIVQTTRKRWHGTNLVLAAVPFIAFVYGTFLTRSGYLSDVSVHSFAKMDESALKILLGFLLLTVFGFAALYLAKGRPLARRMDAPLEDDGIQRESLYRSGSILLGLIAIVIAVGMSWPVIMALSGRSVSVIEEKTYHLVLSWFFPPLMVMMAIAPFVGWRKMAPGQVWNRVLWAFSAAIFLTGLATLAYQNPVWGVHLKEEQTIDFPFGFKAPLLPWMAFLTFLCVFVAVVSLLRIAQVWKRSKMSIGGFVSHLGVAVLMGGLIVSRGFEQKDETAVRPDRPTPSLDYNLTYRGMTHPDDMYNRDNKVLFDVTGRGTRYEARPGLYYYPGRDEAGNPEDKAMVWPHIHREISHDVYMAMGEPQVFIWEKPVRLKPGEEHTERGITVRFLKSFREGEPGMTGTKFGAEVMVTLEDRKKFTAKPYFELGAGPQIVGVNEDLAVVMPGMDVASGAVDVQMLFAVPIYPVNLYYKPMTILVWSGAGILFVGGLIAAFYRRFRPTSPALLRTTEDLEPSDSQDAPVPVAQS